MYSIGVRVLLRNRSKECCAGSVSLREGIFDQFMGLEKTQQREEFGLVLICGGNSVLESQQRLED